MNDGLRLFTGTVLLGLLALRCTALDSASDEFTAGGAGGAGAAGATSGGPGTGGSGANGGLPGAGTAGGGMAGNSAAAGTSAAAGKAGHAAAAGEGGVGGNGGKPSSGSSGAHASAGEDSAGIGGDAGGGGVPGDDCVDETGFDGLGCYTCAPTDIVTLEQACTDALCTRFNNILRLTLLPSDGHLPELPAPAGGGTGGGAGVGGAGGAAGSTGTGVACSDLASSGTVVYVTGSSAAKPFLQQIAQQLSGGSVFIVYTSTGSCIGVDAIVNGTPMKTGSAPAPAASATYWESSSSSGKACDLPAEGVPADIGISDVFAATCPGFELTDLDAQDIRDAHGPIQTMTFAVPTNSPYSEISAQAAYFVFGFGADGGVRAPTLSDPVWNDESFLFQRSATSGTQAMIAAAIGVPATRWKGKPHKSSDDVAADLQAAAGTVETAQKALGILAADYIDTKNLRAQIKVLAYQDTRQPCAVFPDSTATAHDKANVRDGHYPIWSPLHLLYKTDPAGNPVNEQNRQAITDIIGYLAGTKSLPNGVKLLDVYAQSGLIPECAMRVTRRQDGGNLAPKRPASPCSCLFELKATGVTTCTPCTVQGDCHDGGTCSQGYCEK